MSETANFKIKRRDDLIPAAVALKYRVTSSNNGQAVVQVVNDITTTVGGSVIEGIGVTGLLQTPAHFVAADATYIASGTQTSMQNAARTFAAQATTIDMEGFQSISGTVGCVPVHAGDPTGETSGGNEYDFWTAIFPELAGVGNLAFYDATNKPATVVDDTGASVDLTTYAYRLTKGQIAPWMSGGAGAGLAKKCTVKAYFKYDQKTQVSANSVNNAKTVWHEKTATVTLTNLAAGTYGITTSGEVVPYGLAGYIYSIESMPQYEGTFTIQESEITDPCPIGNNLNLTGGLSEWGTMNAVVQSVSYDLLSGRTTLTFGPAAHLGAKDLVERLRVNRGPRWYYSIGGNMINSGTSGYQLGNFTPDQGPSPNNAVPSIQTLPSDIGDWLTNNADYTVGAPGVTHDATGLIDYGNVGGGSPSETALIHLADGSGGGISSFAHLNSNGTLHLEDDTGGGTSIIRAAISDIPEGFDWASCGPLKFREVQDCVSIDGTPTTVYRQALVSGYYTSALGNT
jgi:hypothetical protein